MNLSWHIPWTHCITFDFTPFPLVSLKPFLYKSILISRAAIRLLETLVKS